MSNRRIKAESKPITFRSDATQPYDDRCLSWQYDQQRVSIWTTAGRIKNVRFACSADALRTIREYRKGEADLIERDGAFYLVAFLADVDRATQRWGGKRRRPSLMLEGLQSILVGAFAAPADAFRTFPGEPQGCRLLGGTSALCFYMRVENARGGGDVPDRPDGNGEQAGRTRHGEQGIRHRVRPQKQFVRPRQPSVVSEGLSWLRRDWTRRGRSRPCRRYSPHRCRP